jgi:hypothetical protein
MENFAWKDKKRLGSLSDRAVRTHWGEEDTI